MDTSSNDYIKGAVEALLFVSDKPVTLDQIKEAIESVEAGDIRRIIFELKAEYEQQRRGMMVVEIAGGYQVLSNPSYASFVRNFFKKRVKEKLSRPALEALAIVAYKQPVSRADVEVVRGVNSDGVVSNLMEKGLIKIVGRKDVPGRPYLYGTTKQFLEYFGLKTLTDMPKLESIASILIQAQEGDILPIEDAQSGEEGSVTEQGVTEEVVTLKEAMDDVNQGKISLEPEEGEAEAESETSEKKNNLDKTEAVL